MNIQAIEACDLTALAKLYVKVFEAKPWSETWKVDWAYSRLQLIFKSPQFTGYMYCNEQGPIAAALGRGNNFQGKKEYELVEFFVAPEAQSQGIGSRLYQNTAQQLKAQGYDLVTLITSRELPAFRFYQKQGFKHGESMAFLYSEL